MDRNSVLKQVNDIFIDTLDDEDIVIQESTSADDVEDWDSLTHIQLVVGVEKKNWIAIYVVGDPELEKCGRNDRLYS